MDSSGSRASTASSRDDDREVEIEPGQRVDGTVGAPS